MKRNYTNYKFVEEYSKKDSAKKNSEYSESSVMKMNNFESTSQPQTSELSIINEFEHGESDCEANLRTLTYLSSQLDISAKYGLERIQQINILSQDIQLLRKYFENGEVSSEELFSSLESKKQELSKIIQNSANKNINIIRDIEDLQSSIKAQISKDYIKKQLQSQMEQRPK